MINGYNGTSAATGGVTNGFNLDSIKEAIALVNQLQQEILEANPFYQLMIQQGRDPKDGYYILVPDSLLVKAGYAPPFIDLPDFLKVNRIDQNIYFFKGEDNVKEQKYLGFIDQIRSSNPFIRFGV